MPYKNWKLPFFSISAINSFDACPFQYYLAKIKKEKVPQPPSSILEFGSLVHKCAQHENFSLEFANKLREVDFPNIEQEEIDKNLEPCLINTQRYVKSLNEQYPLHFSEEFVNHFGKRYNITTVIDRKCVDDKKRIVKIVDYKTKRNFKKAENDEQLKMYHMLTPAWYRAQFNEKPDKIICEVFYNILDKIDEREFTDKEIIQFTRKLIDKIEYILNQKTFPAKPGKWNCKYCQYRNNRKLCPQGIGDLESR